MIRIAVVALLVAAGGAIFRAHAAYASSSTPTKIDYTALSSTEKAREEQVILHWTDPGITADAASGLEEAAVAGGAEMSLSSILGPTAVIVAGSVVVAKIADGLGLGNFVYRSITGEDSPPGTGSAITGTQWRWIPSGGVWIAGILCPASCGGGGSPTEVWCTGSSFNNPQPRPILQPMGPNVTASGGSGFCSSGAAMSTQTTNVAQISGLGFGARVAPATAAQFNSTPAAQQVTPAGAEPTTCNDTCLQTGLAQINANAPASRTGKESSAVDQIAKGAPVGTPGVTGAPVVVLQPQPNETYTDYVGRLQQHGYLGTATTTAETTALVGYGPNAVTRVSFPDSYGKTQTLDPLTWPTPSPTIAPSASITLRYNPPTAVPAPTTGTAPGAQTCGAVANPCAVQDTTPGPDSTPGTLDWSPLQVPLGSRFPFGVFGYLQTFFSGNGTADGSPPCIGPFGNPPGLSLSSSTRTICLPSNSSWRSYVDALMKLMTVCASIYFAGTWLLGWGKADTLDGD